MSTEQHDHPERTNETPQIHVLRLSGDDYEIGHQHGTQLREAVHRGPLPVFATSLEHLIDGSGFGLLAKPVTRLLQASVGRRIAAGIPAFAEQTLRGLADGARLPFRTVLHAATFPETLLWLFRHLSRVRRVPLAPRLGMPTLGCSSAAAWGAATQSGGLLHGRNFDYMGVGSWDLEQAVFFIDPASGQPYASIAAAGIPLGGVTSMNQAGLTLAVHQHFSCTDTALGGTPTGIVGDQVMRYAANLDDARRILDDHTPIGCFSYLIGSGPERALLCYEVTPARRAAWIVEDDTFAYTNAYLDRELAAREVYVYPSHWRGTAKRYHHLQALLKAHHGSIEADTVASLLGDRVDPRCRISWAVGALHTVTSVVFAPEEGLFYVGLGPSPTSNQPYLAFDMARRDRRTDLPNLEGGVPSDADERAGVQAYRDAFVAWNRHNGKAAAREAIERACTLQPHEPLYQFIAGLVALDADDPAAAVRSLDRALDLGHPDAERVAAFHLWRARAKDRLGLRSGAREDYRLAIEGDQVVARAARRGVKRRWRAKGVSVDFVYADVMFP
ncbi:MAG: hypothetical protein JRI25_26605 [Deltaproteobacteria bacterium]|nr:hypothetical protein [Deltaproteobacteria bacterium]